MSTRIPPPLSADEEPKVDASQWVAKALRYISQGRLMTICLALGVIAGLVYFVYSRPLYSSRSMVRFTMLSLPVNSDSGRSDTAMNSNNRAIALRALRTQLTSAQIQTLVARRLGVATSTASPESIRQFAIPTVSISFLDSDFMELNVVSYYPNVVRDYARTLVEVYTEFEKEARETYRGIVLDTYMKELDEFRSKLDEQLKKRMDFEESNSLAQVFIQQNSLTHVPKEIVLTKERIQKLMDARTRLGDKSLGDDVIAKLSLLTSARKDSQVDLEVGSVVRNSATGTIQAVSGGKGEIIVSPSLAETMEPWQLLEKRQRELQEELRRASGIYQPGHEVMRKLSEELAAIKDKLKAELQVATQRFEIDIAQLGEKLKSLESKLPEYNEVTAKYEKFRQDYQLIEKGQLDWDKAHSELATRVSKLQFGADKERFLLEYDSTLSLRDVDPVSPNKTKLALVSAGLGLLLAFGVPTCLMLLDSSVNRLTEIEARTGVRGIGLIPLAAKEFLEDIFRSPTLDAKVPNFLLEAHRIIRSNINLHPGKNGKSQVVMVTSARPSEGKTTLAANLAWAFHSMGESVLLVDCDLRRGRVAIITQVSNDVGLSRLIMDEAVPGQAILHTREDALDVIPRGPIVAGVTELLCTDRFEELVEQWKLKYDRVILDTPPVLGLSETNTLQRVADGVVLVIRAHKTLTKDVVEAVDTLKRTGTHLFGMVLNAVDLSKLANHYTYYYYSPLYYSELETHP
jgi:capsular exopolysaccharide synthesis family protein